MEAQFHITIGQLIDFGVWEKACDFYGLDADCVNDEGVSIGTKLLMSKSTAKEIGLLEKMS